MAIPQQRTEAAGRLVAAIHDYLMTKPEPRHESDGLPANLSDIEAASDRVCEALIDCAEAGATLADLQHAISHQLAAVAGHAGVV